MTREKEGQGNREEDGKDDIKAKRFRWNFDVVYGHYLFFLLCGFGFSWIPKIDTPQSFRSSSSSSKSMMCQNTL